MTEGNESPLQLRSAMQPVSNLNTAINLRKVSAGVNFKPQPGKTNERFNQSQLSDLPHVNGLSPDGRASGVLSSIEAHSQ